MTTPTGRSGRSLLVRAGFLVAGLNLAACAETGDFGRPRPGLWNDVVLPSTGAIAARARGEAVSAYVETDDEAELRARAWRFVMPAHERAAFERTLANLVRTRVLPLAARPSDRAAYHRALMADSGRSPASRYRRLAEDMLADAQLIPPFAAVAARVLAADEVRLKSLSFVQELSEPELRQAVARVLENRCIIAWVGFESAERIETYRYALEHLVIEAPQMEGVSAERALFHLEEQRALLDRLPVPALGRMPCAGPDVQVVALARPPAAPPPVVKD